MSKIIYALTGMEQGRVEGGNYSQFGASYTDQNGIPRYLLGSILINKSSDSLLSAEEVAIKLPGVDNEQNVRFVVIPPDLTIDDTVAANNERELAKYDAVVKEIRDSVATSQSKHDLKLFYDRFGAAIQLEQEDIKKRLGKTAVSSAKKRP